MQRLLGLLVLVSSLGCGVPPGPAATHPAPTRDASRVEDPLPALVVTTPRTRFVAGADRAIVAVPKARLPLRVRTDVDAPAGLVAVTLEGGIALTAYVPREQLGALVCGAGLAGDRLYVAERNLVGLGRSLGGGRFAVRGDVVLRAAAGAPPRLRTHAVDGEIAAQRLCRAMPPARHAGTPEDPVVVHPLGDVDPEDFPRDTSWIEVPANEEVRLLATPAGPVMATLPAEAHERRVPVVRSEAGAHLVAVGSGPYLAAWVTGARPVPPDDADVVDLVGGLAGGVVHRPRAPYALHAKDVAKQPLHTLAAGTRVELGGGATAELVRPGYARAGEARGTRTWVSAAVDDDVLVRGWVDTAVLGATVPE